MQRTDLLIQDRDVKPLQRGSADVASAVGVLVHDTHSVARSADLYRFPRTPDARRRKLSANTRPQSTSDTLRTQLIKNATANAYNQFERRETEFTPEEVRAYAQWILQADQLLEVMRQQTERGDK